MGDITILLETICHSHVRRARIITMLLFTFRDLQKWTDPNEHAVRLPVPKQTRVYLKSRRQRIFDLGGTIASKLCDSVTHILCNDAEFAKQSAKVKAVLAHNAREDVPRIWIVGFSSLTDHTRADSDRVSHSKVDQAWLEETEEIGERPLEEEWDLELNLDEEDAQIDEEERQAREVKAQERKRKREEDADASVDLDEPTGATIDPDCHLAGMSTISRSASHRT